MSWDQLIWIVPLAVLVAGLRSPRGGILVLFGALPLFGSPPGGPYLAAFDAAALAAIATAWRVPPPPPSLLDRLAVGVVATGLATLVPIAWLPPGWSPRVLLGALEALGQAQRATTLYTWRAALNLVLGWLLYRAVRRAFAGRSPRPLAVAVAVGLIPTLALALLDGAGWVDLWSYRPIGRDIYDSRLHSLFFHSAWLAEYLVLATPWVLGALVGRARWLTVALAVLAPAVLLLTLQRGAWYAVLAQVLAALILVGLRRRDRRATARRVAVSVALSGILVAALLWVQPGIRQALGERLAQATGDLSARSRVWQRTARLAAERPVMGWGLGSFASVYGWPESDEHQWLTAHDHYLMVAVEQGALGVAVWGVLVCAAGWALARAVRGRDRERRRLALALIVSGVGGLVYGVVQYLFFLRAIEWLCWGLLAAVADLGSAEPASRSRGRLPLAALLLLLAALVPLRALRLEPVPGAEKGYGLHGQEMTGDGVRFRWIEGRAAFRMQRLGPVMLLRLANGRSQPEKRPVAVTVWLDGREALRTVVRGGWEPHRLEVDLGRREPLLVEISARPSFRPYREPPVEGARSRDIRRLAVAMAMPRWPGVNAPEPPSPSPPPPASPSGD